jgi:hypothetical protein
MCVVYKKVHLSSANALEQDPEERHTISRVKHEVDNILTAGYDNDMRKRALLKKVMRRTIFPQGAKFPQLKFTPVVKA